MRKSGAGIALAMWMTAVAAHAQDIHDKLDPVPLTSNASLPGLAMAAIVAALVAVAGCLLLLRWRPQALRKGTTDRFETRARRRLAEVTETQGKPELLYMQLSCILTEYLEERLELPVTRYTSGEILLALRRAGLAPEPLADVVEGFLTECDYGKFSGFAISDPTAVVRCREIVDRLGGQIASTPRMATPHRGFRHAGI